LRRDLQQRPSWRGRRPSGRRLLTTIDAGVKRALDFVLAGVLLVLLAVPIVLLALAIRLDSPGPAFFRCRRIGFRGREFRMFKFRKMHDDASGPALTAKGDARFTRLGRFLAETKLDELPQLWNVLRGQMSIVGPRPDLVEQVANYEPEDRRRLAVKPGITGWAQVMGRDEIPWEERFRLDAWYVDNWSLRLDARIVLMTFTQLGRPEPEPVEDALNIERARRSQTRS
jgi:lipopolysaccharide/colanic/teichoic acid biosynthesis glycosyltransferase